MPFPFLPLGAILAASVLIAALTVFGLVLRAIDRAIVRARDTMLSGLVSGFRSWEQSRGARPVTVSPAPAASSAADIVELRSGPIQ